MLPWKTTHFLWFFLITVYLLPFICKVVSGNLTMRLPLTSPVETWLNSCTTHKYKELFQEFQSVQIVWILRAGTLLVLLTCFFILRPNKQTSNNSAFAKSLMYNKTQVKDSKHHLYFNLFWPSSPIRCVFLNVPLISNQIRSEYQTKKAWFCSDIIVKMDCWSLQVSWNQICLVCM